MFTTFLFDMDGTVSDSYPGVSNGMAYALEQLGKPRPNEATLRECMGPPLMDSFTKNLCLSEDEARRAVAIYREYYPRQGINEQTIMDGAEYIVKRLKELGKTVALATCKPQKYSEIILENANLAQYFDVIQGSTFDGTISEKYQVVSLVLEKTGKSPAECLMIGDRYFDVTGAHACGVKCAGVLCGYGSREEFEKCGADYILDTLYDVEKLVR